MPLRKYYNPSILPLVQPLWDTNESKACYSEQNSILPLASICHCEVLIRVSNAVPDALKSGVGMILFRTVRIVFTVSYMNIINIFIIWSHLFDCSGIFLNFTWKTKPEIL